MNNMHTFTITYDRHEGKYGFKLSDFPDSYTHLECWADHIKDPDWLYKMQPTRFRGKLTFFITFL